MIATQADKDTAASIFLRLYSTLHSSTTEAVVKLSGDVVEAAEASSHLKGTYCKEIDVKSSSKQEIYCFRHTYKISKFFTHLGVVLQGFTIVRWAHREESQRVVF